MPNERQRRQAERRRMQRQLERRREREAARRKRNLIISIVGTLVLIGAVIGIIIGTSGGDKNTPAASKKSSSTSSSVSPSPTPSSTTPSPSPTKKVAAYPCTWTKAGAITKKVAVPSTTRPPRTGTTAVALHTNRGTIGLTLNRKAAPCAVASFVSLAKQHFFDNTPCHRLTSGGLSVLQCGDPTGSGQGGPGYSFADELTGKEKYTRGVLAMANSGANTNGSQFFIVYKDSSLPPSYTVFGSVSAGGLKVVDTVAAKGSTPANDGKPNLPVTITKAVAGA